jgi:hypothetical protein
MSRRKVQLQKDTIAPSNLVSYSIDDTEGTEFIILEQGHVFVASLFET